MLHDFKPASVEEVIAVFIEQNIVLNPNISFHLLYSSDSAHSRTNSQPREAAGLKISCIVPASRESFKKRIMFPTSKLEITKTYNAVLACLNGKPALEGLAAKIIKVLKHMKEDVKIVRADRPNVLVAQEAMNNRIKEGIQVVKEQEPHNLERVREAVNEFWTEIIHMQEQYVESEQKVLANLRKLKEEHGRS